MLYAITISHSHVVEYIKFCWRDGHSAVVFSLQFSQRIYGECDQFYVTNSLTWTYFVYVIVGSRYTTDWRYFNFTHSKRFWNVICLGTLYTIDDGLYTEYTIQILYFDNSVEPTWSHITASIWEQKVFSKQSQSFTYCGYIACLKRSY